MVAVKYLNLVLGNSEKSKLYWQFNLVCSRLFFSLPPLHLPLGFSMSPYPSTLRVVPLPLRSRPFDRPPGQPGRTGNPTVDLRADGTAVPIFDPGSGGYAYQKAIVDFWKLTDTPNDKAAPGSAWTGQSAPRALESHSMAS